MFPRVTALDWGAFLAAANGRLSLRHVGGG